MNNKQWLFIDKRIINQKNYQWKHIKTPIKKSKYNENYYTIYLVVISYQKKLHHLVALKMPGPTVHPGTRCYCLNVLTPASSTEYKTKHKAANHKGCTNVNQGNKNVLFVLQDSSIISAHIHLRFLLWLWQLINNGFWFRALFNIILIGS